MSEVNIKQIIEGLLMVSEQPLRIDDIYKVINSDNNLFKINELQVIIDEIVNDYSDSGIELKEVASGWRFQVKKDLSPWVNKLYAERPPRYSRALLETLALIAYRQPVTRAEIEKVRGVTVSTNIMKTLIEHEWVCVVGYKEVPGRPAIFATTKKFLDYFNLQSLEELPPLMEFTETINTEIKPDPKIEVTLANEATLEVNENSIEQEEIEMLDIDSTMADNSDSEI